jgi:hypothetical protein
MEGAVGYRAFSARRGPVHEADPGQRQATSWLPDETALHGHRQRRQHGTRASARRGVSLCRRCYSSTIFFLLLLVRGSAPRRSVHVIASESVRLVLCSSVFRWSEERARVDCEPRVYYTTEEGENHVGPSRHDSLSEANHVDVEGDPQWSCISSSAGLDRHCLTLESLLRFDPSLEANPP